VRDLAGAGALFLLPWWWHRIVVARPFPGIQFHESTDLSVYASEALLLVAVGAWLVSHPGRPLLPGWLMWPLLGLPVIALVLVPLAVDPVLALYHALRLGLVTAWALVVASSSRLRRWAPGALLATASLQAIIALGQVSLQRDLGLQVLGEVPMSPTMPGVSILSYAGTRWMRPYGLAQHPNILAGTLAVALLLGLGRLSLGQTRRRAWWAVGRVASRLSLAERRRLLLRVGLPIAILATGFVVMAWPLLASRFGLTTAGSEMRSVDERSVMLHIALRQLVAQPVPGIGLGQFSRLALAEGNDLLGHYPPQPVHVVPLLVTIELGPLGAALWLWLALAPVGALLLQRRLPFELSGPTAAWLALLVIGLFDFYPFQVTQGRLLTWTVLALWGAGWIEDQMTEIGEESHV
jgi:hypothetical protein